ncbi:ORF6N domain-containing protein [Leadbetterella sp. DM7]|uniref:ORF6N domain-containing protein n=1 Tax=Leadbetterella sp. DM7 TaxID=3235085 RepID=UPI00349E9BC1
MSQELSITQAYIEDRIFTIRGMQVMLDRDLAEMYQVEVRVLNQAVKRNIERFPENFRFQLTEEEISELVTKCDRFKSREAPIVTSGSRSQFVILNDKRGQNIKYLPYAFNEQGVAMLSAVLRSHVAIKVSIQIMDAFVTMRKMISSHSGLLQRMDSFERRQLETDQKVERVFKALEGNTVPIRFKKAHESNLYPRRNSSVIIRFLPSS